MALNELFRQFSMGAVVVILILVTAVYYFFLSLFYSFMAGQALKMVKQKQ